MREFEVREVSPKELSLADVVTITGLPGRYVVTAIVTDKQRGVGVELLSELVDAIAYKLEIFDMRVNLQPSLRRLRAQIICRNGTVE